MLPHPVVRVLGLLLLAGSLQLAAADRAYQKGVVIDAESYAPDRPGHHWKRTDARTPTTESDYLVTIRVKCEVYVARYQSADDYVPTIFAKDQPVEASINKNVMYVKLPSGGETKMGVTEKHAEPHCTNP